MPTRPRRRPRLWKAARPASQRLTRSPNPIRPRPLTQATEDDDSEGAEEDAADIADIAGEEDIAADADLRTDNENPAIWMGHEIIDPSNGIITSLMQEIGDQYANGLTAVMTDMGCGNFGSDMPADVDALFAYRNEEGENITFRFFRCSATQKEDGGYHMTIISVDEWDAE